MLNLFLISAFIAIQLVTILFLWGNDTKFFNKSIKDFTIVELLFKPLTIPGFIIHRVFTFLLSGLVPFIVKVISFKPFKRAKFKVGEYVIYKGNQYYVVENELQNDGDILVLGMETSLYLTKVEAKEVRKVSKLEQALK